jgi:nitrite reductase/ring-hydroxylating ferredoxin subunit
VSEIQDDPLQLIVGKRKLQVEHVVIATHVPLIGAAGLLQATLLQTNLFPYSSYAIGAQVPKGTVPEACFWDTADPYYYLRVDAGRQSDYVIFGGVDHKTGQEPDTESRFESLRETLQQILPDAQPDRRWSGQVIETNDGLPFLGETAPRQFVATGYSGNGMTFGTLAGMMVCDAIMERSNPWKDLFAVERKKLHGGTWDYLVENIDFPYYFVRDRLLGKQANSPDEVKPGEGKVVKLDGKWVACSRDQSGHLSQVSAHCTHMGCLVRWNSAEGTWDCPCHGSRFQCDGQVIGGPAEAALDSVAVIESVN